MQLATPIRTLTRLARLVPLALVALATGAHAQTLDVALQCWAGTAEGPHLATIAFTDVDQPYGCKVLVSNNSGQNLTNIPVTLTFGQHPDAALSQNTNFLDGANNPQDAAAYFNCPSSPPTGATFRPNMVMDVRAAFPGFPSGTPASAMGTDYPYGLRCWDYNVVPKVTWSLSVASGETATLRVDFSSGYLVEGATFDTALTLAVGTLPNGLPAVSPVAFPVHVAMPVHPLTTAMNSYGATLDQSPTMTLAGAARIGHAGWYDRRGAHTGMSADLYLPYLRTANCSGACPEVRADGQYNAGAGDLLLFNPNDLQLAIGSFSYYAPHMASRFMDTATGQDLLDWGNRPVPIIKLADDHYFIEWGHLSGNAANLGARTVSFSWAASFDRGGVRAAFLDAKANASVAAAKLLVTGRVCGRSDQSGEVCTAVEATLYPEADLITRNINAATHGLNVGHPEANRMTPFQRELGIVQASYALRRDMTWDLAMQFPLDSTGVRAEPVYFYKSKYAWDVPWLFELGSDPADGSHEADMRLRTVPVSTAWQTLGPTAPEVPYALPPTTTEIRAHCEPSRYGVRAYAAPECRWLYEFKVPRAARSSIDGSAYIAHDMTRASLGAAARMTLLDDEGDVVAARTAPYNIEVDGASLTRVFFNRDAQGPGWPGLQTIANAQERTVNTNAAAGCAFANLGLDNVKGPVTMVLHYPVGFAFTAPPNALEDAVVALFGGETLTGNPASGSTAIVPADRRTIAIDTSARTVTVTFAGPQADATFPGADQVVLPATDYSDARWVAFKVHGVHLPGVDRAPLWSCDITHASRTLSDGSTQANITQTISGAQPFVILGAPNPVIAGDTDREVVPTGCTWTTTIDQRNPAYAANGTILPTGAALSARDGVVYMRVPRDGDIAPALQNGALDVVFTSASSGDARPIYVSTDDAPPRPLASQLGGPAWRLCADGGAPCNAAAIAAIADGGPAIVADDVRWVAFAIGELLVTDAEPRGVAPRNGAQRVDNPYLSYVTLTDRGSDSGALARPEVWFVSNDNVPLAPEADRYDVTLQDFDICACDDDPTVDLGLGDACSVGTAPCSAAGVLECGSGAAAGTVVCSVTLADVAGDPCDDDADLCASGHCDATGACIQDTVTSCGGATVGACSAACDPDTGACTDPVLPAECSPPTNGHVFYVPVTGPAGPRQVRCVAYPDQPGVSPTCELIAGNYCGEGE